MRWEKVEVKMEGQDEKGPGKRWGHTCNAVKGGSFLYLFGGYGKHNSQTNQVHVFDTLNQTWSEPVIKGSPPTPRDSHTCTAIGDNLFVFGGTDGVNPLKDLHMLDISSHTWISPTIRGDGPEAREGHSAAVVGKRIFIFGGCGKSADNDNEVYYNDLYILNTETFVWKCATTSGTPPSPRDSHSCSSWKNKIIVIGGEDGHDYYLSDVHILDTDTLIWRELTTSGQLLPPRAGHSTVSFGKNLFVFGGFTDAQNLYNDLYMLDIDTGVWTNVTTITNSPCARFSVAGDCVDPIKGGVLVFIGGCNKSLEALDDMYYLYTGMTRESGQRPEKLSLRKQLKLKCQEQNLNPVQNDVLVRYGVSADMRPPMTVLNCSQPSGLNIPVNQPLPPPGKKMFEAKVTKNIFEGYAIETVIDGKPLRGILFSNKPSSLPPSAHTSTRKRTAEIGSITPNGAHTNMSKTPKVDELKNRHAVHGDSSESHEHHCIEAVASLPSSNPTTADASLPSRNPTTADASLPSWNPTTADVSLPSSNPTTDVASLPSSNPTTADASLQSSNPTTADASLQSSNPTTAVASLPSSNPTTADASLQSSNPTSADASLPSSNPTTADASLQSSNPTTADASLPSSNPTTADASLPSSNPTTADASLPSSNPTTADASLPSSNPTTADASVIHKDSVNREPEVAYLNQIDGGKYETPKFLGGNLKNDGANDVASSTGDDNINDQTNVSISMPEVPRNDNRNDAPNCNTESSNPVSISMPEVPRHDDRNDAPNCNTESSNPVATESAACLSNQGVMMDSTSARTEENSEAAKLT